MRRSIIIGLDPAVLPTAHGFEAEISSSKETLLHLERTHAATDRHCRHAAGCRGTD